MIHPKSAINKISPISIDKVFQRNRLFALLGQGSSTNVFWISGPGGCGKTTLMASYLARQKLPCLWYQVDAMDGDPATFFYYFGQAAVPLIDPAAPPMPLLTPEYHSKMDVFILRYFEILYQRIKPFSWIIFDNVQDATKKTPLSKLLAVAVKQLPSHLYMAIISRNEPPPAMSRFIANQTIQLIGWSQLAFSRDEFKEFLTFSKSRIGADEGDKLYQLTKGWIAGAILYLLHPSGDYTSSTLATAPAPGNISNYFIAEILEKSNSEIRQFLLQTAFLPYMTVKMTNELTGMDAESILENLYKKNFFLDKRRLPVVTYRYHPIFHDFLLQQGRKVFSPERLKAARCRAGEILERHGKPEEAFLLYSQADVYESMHAIILSQAETLVNQGRYSLLSAWIESLPHDFITKYPWLLFWQGFACMVLKPQKGKALCSRAFELFFLEEDIKGQIFSWATIIEIFFMLRGNFTDLDHWISEGERVGELLEDIKETKLSERFSCSMLMALLIRNQAHDAMEKWQSRCERLLDRCTDQYVRATLMGNLFWSYSWLGQVDKAIRMEARLSLELDAANQPPLVKIIINCVLSLSFALRGAHQSCRETTAETLVMAEQTGIHIYDFLLLVYSIYPGLGTGDVTQVRPVLKKMKEALIPYAIWDNGLYHFFVAWCAILTGDHSVAGKELQTADKLLEICGNPYTIACARILRSQLYLEMEDPKKAERVLEYALSDKRLSNSTNIHIIMDLAFADCSYAQNHTREAEFHMQSALSNISKNGLSMPFSMINRRLGLLCAKALETGIKERTAVEIIKRWQLQPPQAKPVCERWPWPIKIYVLGHFKVLSGDKILTLSVKTPRKPLELLAMLICAGQTGIFRQKIAGMLWPESDGDRALQTLNTTLHRLRKLLKNNKAIGQRAGQIFLNGNICWVDSWHFQWQGEKLSSRLDQTGVINAVSKAMKLYRGPFTTGHDYLAMAAGYSEQLKKQWLGVVAAAVPLFISGDIKKETERAVQQALAVDETAAAVFSIMAGDFAKNGKHTEVVDILLHCRTLLAKQDIALGQKTLNVLDDLQSK